MSGSNLIRVSERNWERLNARKSPGDSFDDVVSELIDQDERLGAEAEGEAMADA